MAPSSEIGAGYLYQYHNCRILRDGQIVKEDLWVRNGIIENPEVLFFVEKVRADERIDCHNLIISAGYIDVQINGGFGYDFSDPNHVEEGVDVVARGLLSQGVTSFCPTVITSSQETYHKIFPKIRKRDGNAKGAGILGIHAEGPFISKEKKGAHPEHLIQDLNNGFDDVMKMYGDLSNIAIVTLAPEKENSLDVIQELCQRNIIVSVGHSMASLKEGEEAVRSGVRMLTHLFNAMLPFHHRDPHLVGLLASEKLPKNRKVFFGIISDGVHTHPAALRIAHRVHPSGLILVTDAMRAMGYPEGQYKFGEHEVEIVGKRPLLKGTDTLAGSIATLNYCVQHFCKETYCGEVKALEAATLHPAQALGIDDKKGTLDYGTDADFIMLDDDLNVKATYIAGQCVYECSS